MKGGVVVAAAFMLALLAGCTDFSADRTNVLEVRSIDVSAPEVGTGRLVLAVNTTLDNLKAASGDVQLTVKAYDDATGLLVRTGASALGVLPADRTRLVTVRLELPKVAGYRLDVEVFQDGKLAKVSRVTAGNLLALEPNLYDTGLRIATLDFEVLQTHGNRTDVRATVYLTNEGASGSRPLSLQLKAREASTGLLADQVWAGVGAIAPDATHAFNATLSLPGGYNYDVEGVLWDGDIIVERGVGHVQFAPRTTVAPGQSVVVSTPDLGAFARGDQATSAGSAKSPGPGLLLLVAALAATAAVARRKLA